MLLRFYPSALLPGSSRAPKSSSPPFAVATSLCIGCTFSKWVIFYKSKFCRLSRGKKIRLVWFSWSVDFSWQTTVKITAMFEKELKSTALTLSEDGYRVPNFTGTWVVNGAGKFAIPEWRYKSCYFWGYFGIKRPFLHKIPGKIIGKIPEKKIWGISGVIPIKNPWEILAWIPG